MAIRWNEYTQSSTPFETFTKEKGISVFDVWEMILFAYTTSRFYIYKPIDSCVGVFINTVGVIIADEPIADEHVYGEPLL